MKPTRDRGPGFDSRVDVIRHYARVGVKTDQELRRLAAAIVGGPWLWNSLCPSHQTPWELIRSVYFGEADETLGIGPRSGYKTQSVGLLNALDIITRPGVQIAHAAATLPQAQRGQQWTTKYLFSAPVVASGILAGAKPLKWRTQLKNGSIIEVLPATPTGLNSLHVQLLRLDEFELVKSDILDEARLIPQSFDGYSRSILYFSSRKFRDGNVDRMLYDRRNAGVKKVVWCVGEVVEECLESRRGADEEIYENVEDYTDPAAPPLTVKAFTNCGKCVLLPDCRGTFARARGWTKIDDVAAEFKSVDRVTWISQKRCRRVERKGGRVFPRFSRLLNVRQLEPEPGPIRMVVDFSGGVAQTAVLFYQTVNGAAWVLAEYTSRGTGPDQDVPNVEAILADRFPGRTVESAFGDSASPLMIDEWNRRTNLFTLTPVHKLRTKAEMVRVLGALIEPAGGGTKYFVDPSCETHIEELLGFRKRDKIQDNRPKHEEFDDKNVDTVDAALYLALDVKPESTYDDLPGARVISTGTDAVVDSEAPPDPNAIPTLTYADYLGEKFQRLLRRSRDR